MFPGLFDGCGGVGLGLWPGGLRGGWSPGSGYGFPACRGGFGGCGTPVNFGCGCGCGCGVPSGCGYGCGSTFGYGFGATQGCGCGYRWCECDLCNPLGGYGDGPCGGYVSYRDRFGFGCGC